MRVVKFQRAFQNSTVFPTQQRQQLRFGSNEHPMLQVIQILQNKKYRFADEAEAEKRRADFKEYQVNQELIDLADDDVIFMHCLPAIRGEEVSAEVIDGPHSVVYDQAENRMHAQKGVLYYFLKELQNQ